MGKMLGELPYGFKFKIHGGEEIYVKADLGHTDTISGVNIDTGELAVFAEDDVTTYFYRDYVK